jgi:twitching motility two-component system response regulator PilG
MSEMSQFPLPDPDAPKNQPIPGSADSHKSAAASVQPAAGRAPSGERRSRRRALISAPVRVRSIDVTEGGPDEVSTTLDVSRGGVLFVTAASSFEVAMTVAVTFPYSTSPVAVQAEQVGRVARVSRMPDGRYSVAVTLRPGTGDVVDSGGRKIGDASVGEPVAPAYSAELGTKRPLILVVDKDLAVRDSLKSYLTIEGYDVIALSSAAEAHHALGMFTPALLIAEIEGEDLPGYELCAYVKGTPRLQTVPVMLMTSSAYPSDYANAHSLGAVVCIAKPYRQERLGHVVRLLAPIPREKEKAAPLRPADPSRKSCPGNAPNSAGYTPRIRFRPPW